jgi:hypothetical protein
MLVFTDSGKQVSPCIASKARYALGTKINIPTNTKLCSKNYWERVIETICNKHPNLTVNQQSAKEMYNQIFNLNE